MEIVSKTLFDVEVERGGGRDRPLVRPRHPRDRPALPPALSHSRLRFPIPGNLRYRRGVALLDRLVARVLAGASRPPRRPRRPALDAPGRARRRRAARCRTSSCATSSSRSFWRATRRPRSRCPGRSSCCRRTPRAGRSCRSTRSPRPSAIAFRRRPICRAFRFAEAVVKESLRLYPPAYVIGREALADCVLGGYRVPARATIYFSPWVLHRDPRWFAEPEAFRPERWLDGRTVAPSQVRLHPLRRRPQGLHRRAVRHDGRRCSCSRRSAEIPPRDGGAGSRAVSLDHAAARSRPADARCPRHGFRRARRTLTRDALRVRDAAEPCAPTRRTS